MLIVNWEIDENIILRLYFCSVFCFHPIHEQDASYFYSLYLLIFKKNKPYLIFLRHFHDILHMSWVNTFLKIGLWWKTNFPIETDLPAELIIVN